MSVSASLYQSGVPVVSFRPKSGIPTEYKCFWVEEEMSGKRGRTEYLGKLYT